MLTQAEISPGCWLPGHALSAWPPRGLEAAELPCPGLGGPPCREGSEGCLRQQGSGVPSGLGSQEPRDLDPPLPKLPAYPVCCSNLLLLHLKIVTRRF